ncbi:MAG: VOC family protein [Tetrasphaera sp.]|nr:VOC family protein [Tetrasphaera sp.]
MTLDVRWLWVFLEHEGRAAEADAWWAERLRSTISPRRGESGQFATFLPAAGDPWVKTQTVGVLGPGAGTHLDLDVPDPQAAAAVAVTLGARITAGLEGSGYVALLSPGGYPFCMTTASRERTQVLEGEVPDVLDQLCLDLPQERVAAEIGFWEALTGWQWVQSEVAEYGYFRRPEGMPLRILTQRLGEQDGSVRGHVDLACRSVPVTRAAHLAAGARLVADRGFWSHLRDPWGRDYCLTGRWPGTAWVGA